MAPDGTPPAAIKKLSDVVRTTLRAPDTVQKFTTRGLDVIGSTPEELAAHLKREVEKMGRVIRDRGMRAN